MYVNGSMYIDHGEDDICGGIATVTRTDQDERKNWFVEFEGISRRYNLCYLLEQQSKLAAEYGTAAAHPCPDVLGYHCPGTTIPAGITKPIVSQK